MKGYPRWFSPLLISFVMGLMGVTGLLLAPTTLLMRLEVDVPWRLEADFKVATAAVHVLVSLLAIAVVGALSSIHMRTEWRRGNNRTSGVGLVCFISTLSITGLGIYYFGDKLLNTWVGLIHLGLGIGFIILYIGHLVCAKRLQKVAESDF